MDEEISSSGCLVDFSTVEGEFISAQIASIRLFLSLSASSVATACGRLLWRSQRQFDERTVCAYQKTRT
jgi:hypothetical protein